MAYEKTVWEDDITPVNAENLNKLETGVETLDQELERINQGLQGKAENNHTHSGYAATEHTHDDLAREIDALKQAQTPEDSLSEINNEIANIKEELLNKAAENHSHAEIETISNKVIALEETVSDLVSRIESIEQSLRDGSSDGHVHTELEEKVAALETGKAPKVHQHEASDIITSRSAK